VPHQEAVAAFDLVGRHQVDGALVEHPVEHPVAAVRQFEQQRPVAAAHRQQQRHVAREAHQPIAALGQCEIHNRLVGRQRRVDRVVRDRIDALIDPAIAKNLAALVRLPAQNFEPFDSHCIILRALRTASSFRRAANGVNGEAAIII